MDSFNFNSFDFDIDIDTSSLSFSLLRGEFEGRDSEERKESGREEDCDSFPIEFQVDYDEFNVIYRSIASDHPFDYLISSHQFSSQTVSPLSHLSSKEFLIQNTKEAIISIEKEDLSLFPVPPKPLFVGSSQVSLRMSFNEVRARVEETLNLFLEVDFQYLKSQSKWDIVHARGPSYCHFEISLFDENSSSPSYLLEANRLSGDSLSFRLLFNQFKQNLLAPRSPQPVSPQLLSLPVMCPSFNSHSSSEDPLHSLSPILFMISSNSPLDIQLEGVRILCDLTMCIDYHGILVNCCLQRLVSLLIQDNEFHYFGNCDNYESDSGQGLQLGWYALFAIANLSAYRPCQDLLVSDEPFLTYLFQQIADGPHSTAEMRRECARTLANLCVGLASKIVRNLGISYTEKWIETVDSLKDERLRLHATRAKLYIQKCC